LNEKFISCCRSEKNNQFNPTAALRRTEMRTGQARLSQGRQAIGIFALLCGTVLAVDQANAQTNFFSDIPGQSILPVSFLSNCSGGCSSACGDGCSSLLDGCCGRNNGCRRRLLCDLDIGGWMAWGYYDNEHGTDGPNGNSPLGFNNVANQLLMNQAWLYVGKEAKTGCGIDWGFRCDAMFGADGPDTVAFGDGGWDASWQTSGQYGFAVPQLYGELAVGKTKVKAGHFYTIIGYEVVQAPDNFFFSHAYTMYYNEPFTHTGILAERPLGDKVTLYGGWTAGWDSGFENRNDGSTYLGGISFQLTDDINLIYAMTFGDPGDDPNLNTDVYMQSVVCDVALTDKLNYVFHSDFQTRTPDPANGGSWKQYGVNNYLIYELNCKWSVGTRYEWFYVGENAGPPLGPGTLTPGVHYHDLTFGLNWRPRDSFLFKPEVRYDFIDFDGAVAGGPFAQGTRRSQFTWGFQSIFLF
jgi:hypothetical protein